MPDTLENLAMQRPSMNVMGGDVATEWLAWGRIFYNFRYY